MREVVVLRSPTLERLDMDRTAIYHALAIDSYVVDGSACNICFPLLGWVCWVCITKSKLRLCGAEVLHIQWLDATIGHLLVYKIAEFTPSKIDDKVQTMRCQRMVVVRLGQLFVARVVHLVVVGLVGR